VILNKGSINKRTKDKFTKTRVTCFYKLTLIKPYLIDLEISHSFFELFTV